MNDHSFVLAQPVVSSQAGGVCNVCGLPMDSQHFDASAIEEVPARNRRVVLARFELPAQHCGRFENFSQFTDLHARRHEQAQTPGLSWLILVNGRPLDPYLNLQHIVNPWGFGGFAVNIRLDQQAKIELVVRNESYDLDDHQDDPPGQWDPAFIHLVGGRIVGRYWYNPAYGDGAARR